MPKGEWPEIRRLLTKALDSGLRDIDLGLHYFRDASARLLGGHDDGTGRALPTGIAELDRYLFRQGLSAGELGLVLAPTNRGKSIALLSFAQRALLSNAKVVFYSLEMSSHAVASRADAALTGLRMSELDEHPETVAEKLGQLYARYGDAFLIKQWPPHVATVQMVRAHLADLLATGFRPDMLVLDYGDLMRPSARYSERRHELAVVFEEIRGLAVEFDCPVWTASQANRASLKKEIVGLEDLSESFDKAMIADVVLALCQTQEEEQMDPPQMRLFLAKNRSERKGRIVPIETDFARMCFARCRVGG
jgi:replicative DNA helicase